MSISNNVFFDMALNTASGTLSKKGRLFLLMSRLGPKLQKVNWANFKGTGIKERLFLFGRLLKAFAKGEYTSIPWKTVLLITAALIYFISPVDLIPDWLVAVGFTDDFGILMSVYVSVQHELEKFLTWEKSQLAS